VGHIKRVKNKRM